MSKVSRRVRNLSHLVGNATSEVNGVCNRKQVDGTAAWATFESIKIQCAGIMARAELLAMQETAYTGNREILTHINAEVHEQLTALYNAIISVQVSCDHCGNTHPVGMTYCSTNAVINGVRASA